MADHNYQPELCALVGSRMMNLHTPDSDFDYRGFYIADTDHLIDPFSPAPDQIQDNMMSDCDAEYWELNKLVKLATKCNPTALDALHSPRVRIETEAGRTVREARSLFVTKKMTHPFLGYAGSELFKVKRKILGGEPFRWKHLVQCMRLAFQMQHAAKTGEYIVELPEVETDLLRRIKAGRFEPASAISLAEQWMERARRQASCELGLLPELPDKDAIRDVTFVARECARDVRRRSKAYDERGL